MQADGNTRQLCSECARRLLKRLAPDASSHWADVVHLLHRAVEFEEGASKCARCAAELATITNHGAAGCAYCYRQFSRAVEDWLTRWGVPNRHGGEPLPDVAPPIIPLFDTPSPTAYWLHKLEQPQTIISSRARYARNFAWARFPWLADSAELDRVRLRVESSARHSPWHFQVLPAHQMKPSERQRWIDLRLASPQLRDNYLHSSLIVDEACALSVLVNEEDHLRVQAVLPGLQVRESIALARAALETLCLQEELALSENYGWLSASFLNLGWGLRVSVMMHTPALEWSGQLQAVWEAASELGGTIRGLYGEGTPVSALFQVSNVHSIGMDEATIAAQVHGTAQFIAQAEERAQQDLTKLYTQQLREEAEQVYHNLERLHTLKATEGLQMLSVVRLAVGADWGKLTPETWKQMLLAIRWEGPNDDAEWRAMRMRKLVRQVRHA